MNMYELLNELEAELTDKRGLFSKKIDIEKCINIMYEMKEALPISMRESEYIIASKNRILENADNVAKNTIREAEERAVHLIDNSELIKRAEDEAQKIIDSAYMQCDILVDKTKAHLDTCFKDVEQYLLSTINMLRNNREELRNAVITRQIKK